MRVLIIGRTEILYDTTVLLAKQFTICGIITAVASPEYSKNEADFELLAKELGCPFLLTNNINEQAQQFIEQCSPDIGVSLNWVSVIKKETIDLCHLGILNAHPGDLPGYRGNAIFNWVIVKHATTAVLCIHKMEPGELDSGNILLKHSISLSDTTTVKNLVDFWQQETPAMFLEVLNKIVAGDLEEQRQDAMDQTKFRCYPRLPVDSKINWNSSVNDIDALIRASTKPYSGAYCFVKLNLGIKKMYIWQSRIVNEKTDDIGTPGHVIYNDKETGESHIMTGQGVLAINQVQYEDEDIFSPGKTWKSIRMRLNIDIESELISMYKLLAKLGK
jgi:methionyl-tRNA formyltransferase